MNSSDGSGEIEIVPPEAGAGDSHDRTETSAEQLAGMDMRHFREALGELHWSTLTLADILGCDAGTTLAWFHGLESVPPKIGSWLEALVAAHKSVPTPTDYREMDAEAASETGRMA